VLTHATCDIMTPFTTAGCTTARCVGSQATDIAGGADASRASVAGASRDTQAAVASSVPAPRMAARRTSGLGRVLMVILLGPVFINPDAIPRLAGITQKQACLRLIPPKCHNSGVLEMAQR
jgi:hypothetical protein